ncbi:Shedu immune nuclease family protein [Burkholderia cepacia]|uniref:Shedu immune nuclease family protein n=1 Tax=Burkholderia cepacia TaxID=292 RepID=UPI000F596ACC|nr:Shedu immune nuclease family protein [Burkholderia cepacia]NHB09266.1 DUF4263 domain-containing protein [Burkholderia cepacia]RQT69574.1 DUF4263 domain-containing protein [Burkholderia cepacia]
MKEFIHHSLSIKECINELEKFEDLLKSKSEIKERDEILPFFKKNLHLAAFLGTYVPDIANPDRIASEYDIFGDFACDLAVGDSRSETFLLVEFEDAKPESLFVKNGTKTTPEWAPRLEHGFSQVLDWFWKLSDMEKTDDYENRFGARHVAIHGLVVVGRDQTLQSREKARLKWRQDHTIVHSKKVSVITFDQLARDLKYRLSRYPEAAKVERG